MQDIYLDSKNGKTNRSGSRFIGSCVRTLFLALLLTSLIGLDFILYVRSGSVFDGNQGMHLPVLMVLAAIAVVSFVLMIVLSFSKFLQAVVFACFTGGLAWGFMNQFLQIDKSQYLPLYLSSLLDITMLPDFVYTYSHWVCIAVVFFITYKLVREMSNSSLFYLAAVLLLITGVFAGTSMMNNAIHQSADAVYKSMETDFIDNGKKTVFLFMPNVQGLNVQHSTTENDNDNNKTKLLQNMELGFFVKYGFKVYPNAYVLHPMQDANFVETLNTLDIKPFTQHTMSNVGLESLWKFKSPQKAEVYLQDNQLTDVFKKAHYKVSSYQNQRFPFCKKNNQYIVDRCINRANAPFDISSFSDIDRAVLILAQWVSSFDIFTQPEIIEPVKIFLDRDVQSALALPYEQTYVVNSFDVLAQVLKSIEKDTSKAGAYFVYLDFPNNLFVYNEYCKIKPYSQWNTDTPKFKTLGIASPIKSYNEQMLCFWRQMDEFMGQLKIMEVDKNLTFVIQGLGSGLKNSSGSADFIEKFKTQHSVLFAVREPQGNFGVNNQFCQAKDFLRTVLFNAPKCKEFRGLDYSDASQGTIKSQTVANRITKDDVVEASKVYNDKINEKGPSKKVLLDIKATPEELDEPVTLQISEGEILSDEAVRNLTNGEEVSSNPLEIQTEKKTDELSAPEKEEINITPQTETVEASKSETPAEETTTQSVSEPTVSPTTEPVNDKDKKIVEQTEVVEDLPLEYQENVSTPQVPDAEPSVLEQKSNETSQQQPVQTQEEISSESQQQEVSAETSSVQEPQPVSAKEVPVPNAEPQKTENASQQSEPAVSGAFLLEDEEDEEWEFDPAKALGVSGDEAAEEKIIVKVK